MNEKNKATKDPLPAPDWIDKHPDQWPPEIRAAYSILATIAARRLARARDKAKSSQATQTGKAA